MYTLKFNDEVIGVYKDTKECWAKLRDYAENTLKFKVYYYRCNYLDHSGDSIQVDYGSWSNFFYILKGGDNQE